MPRRPAPRWRTEFQASLGGARNILTTRLRKLVADGVLELAPAADGGAFREYHLTARGRGLLPVIVALAYWGGVAGAFELVDKARGKRVRLELRAEDGRRLGPGDVHLVPASGA